MSLIQSYFYFLFQSIRDFRSLVLLIGMATSVTTFGVALIAWYVRYVTLDVSFTIVPLFVQMWTFFFFSFWTVPFFRVWFLNFLVSSSISRFYDKVNLKLGVTQFTPMVITFTLYFSCERSLLVLRSWPDLPDTFIFLSMFSVFRVFVFLPVTFKLSLERLVYRTPALIQQDATRSFFWIFRDQASPVETFARRPGVDKKDIAKGNFALVLGIGGGSLPIGERHLLKYKNELKEMSSAVGEAREKGSLSPSVGEQLANEIEAKWLECHSQNSLSEGVAIVFHSVVGLVLDIDHRTELEISVSEILERASSLIRDAAKK